MSARGERAASPARLPRAPFCSPCPEQLQRGQAPSPVATPLAGIALPPLLGRFLLELEEHLDKDVFLPRLGDVILKHCPNFRQVYIPYITNQIHQEQLLQQLA